jgi:hypothetical protein
MWHLEEARNWGDLGLNGRYEVLVSVGNVYLLSESINNGRKA